MTRNRADQTDSRSRALFAGIVLLVSGSALSVIAAGCVDESNSVAQPSSETRKEKPMSDKVRMDYVVSRGKTPQEWRKAKNQWLAELRKRYQGIDVAARPPDVGEHASRFGELMMEWNPIHCTTEDLKSIAGKPSRETADMIEYKFDEGKVTYSWRCKVSNGIIEGIEYLPGE